MDLAARIAEFVAAPPFAVVGASNDPRKFGHKVLAHYLRHGYRAIPVNPREESILGERCYPRLSELPEPVTSISVITPPAVTESILEEAAEAGVRRAWLQPGAESANAVERGKKLGLTLIQGGPCVLVLLPPR